MGEHLSSGLDLQEKLMDSVHNNDILFGSDLCDHLKK